MPTSYEQLDQLMQDIADAIRYQYSQQHPVSYDFSDMTVFNTICQKETGLTVNQTVFDILSAKLAAYPSFALLRLDYGANEKHLLCFANYSDGETFNISDITVESITNGVRIRNNSSIRVRYGYGYCSSGTVIDTANTFRSMYNDIGPNSYKDFTSGAVHTGNIFSNRVIVSGPMKAQDFSSLIREINT